MSETTITAFAGEYRFLSNFFVEPDGTHVEGEYQCAKTNDPERREQIRNAAPGEAKRLGRLVVIRPDWELLKFQVMAHFVTLKFRDHFDLGARLVATGQTLLVEGNTWHDNVWGDCSCARCASTPGRNWLGLVLMTTRASLAARQ